MLEDYFSQYGGRMFALPEIAGRYSGKNLAICGDAACVWDDLERLGCRKDFRRGSVEKEGFDFMCVNKLGELFPGNIEHWYSNEGNLLAKFVEARRSEYKHEFSGPNHTHSCNKGAKWHWPWGGHGTSGLSAAVTGVALGYDHIWLCGIPLDDGPHNGEPHWRKCRFKTAEVADTKTGGIPHEWKHAINTALKGKVRSMSGRTKEWLDALS